MTMVHGPARKEGRRGTQKRGREEKTDIREGREREKERKKRESLFTLPLILAVPIWQDEAAPDTLQGRELLAITEITMCLHGCVCVCVSVLLAITEITMCLHGCVCV